MNCIKFKVIQFLRFRQGRPRAPWAALGRPMPAGEGGDASPLLSSGGTTPGALHPGLGSPVQEADEDTGVSPGKDHRDD